MDNLLLLDTTSIRSIPHKTVSEVASHDLITLRPDMPIKEAADILSKKAIEGAPVIENNNVMGILTLNDITKAIAQGNEDVEVMEIMSKNIFTVEEELMISDAIEIMNKNKIGRLIVVDHNQIPVGIITRTDLLDKIAGLK